MPQRPSLLEQVASESNHPGFTVAELGGPPTKPLNDFDRMAQGVQPKVAAPPSSVGTGNDFEQMAAAVPGSFSVAELSGPSLLDQVAAEDAATKPPAQTETDPRKTGEIVNDVGQKVIVPKEGESFSDTLKRAVAYHRSLTPEQQQAALDAETKTMPAKAVEAGIGGPLAAVSSYAAGAMVPVVSAALPSVLIHTVEGVKALGAWAEANPYKAFMLYQVAKELLPGAKKAMGLIKAAPEVMP